MKRTLKVVFDDIDEWGNDFGTFYGVSGLFDDDSLVKANKKTREAAQELRGILLQLIDIECDYYLDDKGVASTGRQKWALKAILDAEGGAIYGKPPQNVGTGGTGRGPSRSETPTVAAPPSPGLTSDKDKEIRHAVAAKAAAIFVQGQGWQDFEAAFWNINELLQRASSGPAGSSAGPTPLGQPSQGAPPGPGTSSAGPTTSVGEVEGPAGTTSEAVAASGKGPAASDSKSTKYTGSPPPGWVTE